MADDLEHTRSTGVPQRDPGNPAAEDRLRLEQARLSFALHAVDIVAWEWDPGTNEVIMSETGLRRLGLPIGATLSTAEEFYALIHPDDRPRVEAAVTSALRGESDYDEEFRIVRPDGSIMWCVDKGRLMQVEPDAPPRLSGILLDVTERRVRETQVRELNAELARRAEELQTVLDVLPVGIFIAEDPSCTEIRTNPAGAAMLGIGSEANASKSAPDAATLPFRVMRDGAEVSAEELPMQRSARTGVTVRGEEAEVVRDDETVTWLSMDAMPLFDERHRLRGCVGSFIDVTERKLAEAAREQEARRKDEFLATLAHELRNPLAPIRMALELLRLRGSGDADQRSSIAVIDRQVEHLTRLVDDLLDISRISRGKFELRKEWVELAAVIDRALETNAPVFEASGHRVHVDRPAARCRVCGDLIRLAQAIGNLLNNAAKYTPAGGNIWISAESTGGDAMIRVRDDGAGIAPDAMPRIFDPFAQGDTAIERAHGGLGIGLTIAKQLVEMHGGRISAVSDGAGRGSEFVVALPCDPAPEVEPARAADRSARAATANGRRVLVVDDNRDAADTLALLLEFTGNEVVTSYGGRDALEASLSFRPEVVFLDLGMPEMNGFDVARRLREQPETRGALIVAMTGWGQEEDRRRATAAGFDHHLVKPVAAEAVVELLASDTR